MSPSVSEEQGVESTEAEDLISVINAFQEDNPEAEVCHLRLVKSKSKRSILASAHPVKFEGISYDWRREQE